MRPINVVQVVGCMRRAGIETWLMEVARRIDLRRFRLTFCVHANQEADYDGELRALGCRVLRIGCSKRSPAYPFALARCLRQAGPIDVLHSHEHQISGVILAVARSLGVPIRVAHSHNDTARTDSLPNVPRFAFRSIMRRQIRSHATHGFACSELAAPSLFGSNWRRDPRFQLLPYGFDFGRFVAVPPNLGLRAELGIPAGRWVVGHVGRMEPQKNHRFLLEVASQLRDRDPHCHFLFVGDGGLRRAIQAMIVKHSLTDYVTILPNRRDVPEILVNAMDCFLFPSLHEGLPLALIEAQAAALPCVFADTITREANLFPDSNRVLSLRLPASKWAAQIRQLRETPIAAGHLRRAAYLRLTPLAIEESVRRLETLYGEVHATAQ